MNKMTAVMAAALTAAAAMPMSVLANETGQPSAMDKAAATTKDAATTTKIKAKLAADRNLSATDIHVETTAGVVTLSGKVDNEAQVALAEKTVKGIKGVVDVHNELGVKGAD
ncbi:MULTISPECIES: BON domain-containing protein [Hydrocarboniphaga]|jgi:hyperosmotically inducible protein|uniref:Osmotically-inducible protein Y n=1 Tax=Hydrocarboniphaga effusa AP103 TaxID=1172194 RepID=I8I1V3_9GAMM|nr:MULTISPECIES: BON domain-containing protein [Hydrocarboniphaga]EIT69766.1 hypothetical protein WQQ_33480 [Hydrocarboniphaga effusa AP103]MDZ4078852.1 BON domain-containing protein [Hydrocarboniphaga sp.]